MAEKAKVANCVVADWGKGLALYEGMGDSGLEVMGFGMEARDGCLVGDNILAADTTYVEVDSGAEGIGVAIVAEAADNEEDSLDRVEDKGAAAERVSS